MILIFQFLIQRLNQIFLLGELHFVTVYHALELSLILQVIECSYKVLAFSSFVLILQRSKRALGTFARLFQVSAGQCHARFVRPFPSSPFVELSFPSPFIELTKLSN